MKKLLPIALVAASLVALGLAPGRAQDADEAGAGGDLQRRVADLERTVEVLERANLELAKKNAAVLAYLQKQATHGEVLLGQLDEAERMGFTAGINPRSKELVLGALRSDLEQRKADLPKDPAPAERE